MSWAHTLSITRWRLIVQYVHNGSYSQKQELITCFINGDMAPECSATSSDKLPICNFVVVEYPDRFVQLLGMTICDKHFCVIAIEMPHYETQVWVIFIF